MRCPNCQEEMQADEAPAEVFRIGRFALWRYETVHTCVECEIDKQAYHEQRIFDAGTEHGWDQAYKSRNGISSR